MKTACHITLVLLVFLFIPREVLSSPLLREGDIVMQHLPSTLGSVIADVTNSPYSHMGLVVQKNGRFTILEAIGPVKYTTLQDWYAQGYGGWVAVLRPRHLSPHQVESAIIKAKELIGTPYDLQYELDDKKIYCSELVYKAYLRGPGITFGKVEKLRDLDWKPHELYIRYLAGGLLPLDREMVTPASIARDNGLEMIFSTFPKNEWWDNSLPLIEGMEEQFAPQLNNFLDDKPVKVSDANKFETQTIEKSDKPLETLSNNFPAVSQQAGRSKKSYMIITPYSKGARLKKNNIKKGPLSLLEGLWAGAYTIYQYKTVQLNLHLGSDGTLIKGDIHWGDWNNIPIKSVMIKEGRKKGSYSAQLVDARGVRSNLDARLAAGGTKLIGNWADHLGNQGIFSIERRLLKDY